MSPSVIKLGGASLDSEEALERLFIALMNYRELHQRPLIIVHGGGYVVDELMKQLNLLVKKEDGLCVTPADQTDIIAGVLTGAVNKTLLIWMKKHHIAFVGLYLGDGDSVKVTPFDKELDHVRLVQPGSPKLISTLLKNGSPPVASSVGVTDDSLLMSVNADQATTVPTVTLGTDPILLSDVSGTLDGKGQYIAEMAVTKTEQLIEQGITIDGMIVEVSTALGVVRTLGRPVDITPWRRAERLPVLFDGMSVDARVLA